ADEVRADHLVVLIELDVPSPCFRARFGEGGKSKRHSEAVARGREAKGLGEIALDLTQIADHTSVQAEGGNDALAILELELLLYRFTVAGRCRDVGDSHRVGHP